MTNFRTAITANVLALAVVASAPALAVTLDELRERGAVRAAFANESPYGYVNEEGVLTGESPEVARVIFGRLGVENLDGILTEWASLLPGLNAGRWDMVAAGMFITPERCKEVAFSNPSYMMGQSFLVQAGNPHDLHSYADVANNDEVTLGVLAGAVERGYARDAGIPDSQVQELPDQTSMLAAVRSGRIDAAALTSVSIERMAQLGGDRVERAEPFDTPPEAIGYGGFAFRKADEALIEEFNVHLADFIGSEEHRELVRPFGFTEANLPGDVTAAELCQGS
ncbi:ectoine/hydroxyectoine ABC transporter substrate-binding protein EhuB [Litchfieldella qijiaojingensis]|uniref:Ectoine/hydroxyectoine ABC transporter substrate-binding protein EhuB n=1 Tax=Litchfieldella qijiaojingensis TaxID=980347 RepID=A0ABQ2YMA0_9GAMM|nr:ectoine/hydroxyectoine ABC transporter substrate-binding protein EhuB [Halomonas qijiaojingensis]GGX87512.1 ectoine/hydroxyectoine ABC transporter substrate-binding protein EhuB [Halomonas qijiaojingensis]